MNLLRLPLAALLLALSFAFGPAQAAADGAALAQGVALRNSGNLQQAIDYFRALGAADESDMATRGELGATLLQARRYDEAEPLLRAAYARTAGGERARHAVELGNLSAARHRPEEALAWYGEAQTLAGGDQALALVARIDAARLAGRLERPALLAAISRELDSLAAAPVQARLRLSLGAQASEVGSLQTAYENLEAGRGLAHAAGAGRIEVEALDGLAQLYETQGRPAEALILNRRAISRAAAADGVYTDILLRLEWRQGRLLAAQGAEAAARAAYERAIEHIESIRQDIPIEYESGRSSFRDTLEPIYLGLIDLLLKKVDSVAASERDALLLRTREVAELVKQSELQDYFGERCSVDVVRNGAGLAVANGTAIIYPIVLPDRIAVIFESSAGMSHATAPLNALALRRLVSSYTQKLRYGEADYRAEAMRLYELLIHPFDSQIAAQGVQTLLVVPDGVLRLLPWATLHDGQQFLVQKYSVAISNGLSLTSQTAEPREKITALVAGLAEPGPVVEKLASSSLVQILEPSAERSGFALALAGKRTVRKLSLARRALALRSAEDMATFRQQLALPGVRREVEALARIMPGTKLLDASFTTDRLRQEFGTGEYRIVHIATHGYFGSTAEASFVMAYDNLVTMDGLQKLLQAEGVKAHPIELLTLSACETAEGDDRSPLGIAGAAIKAKAGSVLGALWPVVDDAAEKVMQTFYSGLLSSGISKAEALRRAQVAFIGSGDFDHPYFWAPFIIVGNWR